MVTQARAGSAAGATGTLQRSWTAGYPPQVTSTMCVGSRAVSKCDAGPGSECSRAGSSAEGMSEVQDSMSPALSHKCDA